MPFGALSSTQRILIRIQLLGGPQYEAQLKKAGIATMGMSAAHNKLSAALATTNKRTFLHNQLLFMARRGLFYATLGTVGLAAATARLGFSYLSTMEQATVALRPVMGGTAALKAEMTELFQIAAKTPFSFADVTQAFRILFVGMRPLGISVQEVNSLLTGMIDAMSFFGILTPAALRRVSVAFQDMANVGRLTGIDINRFGRLGIPLQEILRTQLKLTGDQMERIGELGIPVQDVINAVTVWAKTTPGVAGAALAQSQETLFGAWSTFKDLLSQAVGESEKGIFAAVKRTIVGVNTQLDAMTAARHGDPTTLTMFAQALDKQLTPSTHLILNLFTFLQAALVGLAGTFIVLTKVVGVLLWPFNQLGALFGSSTIAARMVGYAIGILTGLLIASASAYAAYRIVINLTTAALWGNLKAIQGLNIGMRLQALLIGGNGKGLIGRWVAWATATAVSGAAASKAFELGGEEAVKALGKGETVHNGILARMSRSIIDFTSRTKAAFMNNGVIAAFKSGGIKAGVKALIVQFRILTVTLWGTATAAWAAIVPLSPFIALAAALAITLVVLYRKWDAFHRLVNDSLQYIRDHWEWFVATGIPVIGPLIVLMIKLANQFDRAGDGLRRIHHWLQRIADTIPDLPKLPGWMERGIQFINYSAGDLSRDINKRGGR